MKCVGHILLIVGIYFVSSTLNAGNVINTAVGNVRKCHLYYSRKFYENLIYTTVGNVKKCHQLGCQEMLWNVEISYMLEMFRNVEFL